ncbi:MAG: NTP transferase domain-containing protein [Natronohydrobacter sp.]|nr:NTP transferase domain-containing protein [Natronohydrobacter sp.]
MHVIILAAGHGTRLRPHTDDRPKAMALLSDDMPLLEHTMRALSAHASVTAVTIVSGYCAPRIEDLVRRAGLPGVEVVFNSDHATHGPVHSVWQGLRRVDGPMVVMNGDTYFTRQALQDIVSKAQAPAAGESLLFGSDVADFVADDVKVILSPTREISVVGKTVPAERAGMKSAGVLALLHRTHVEAFRQLARDVVSRRTPEPKTWHDLVNRLIDGGLSVRAEFIAPEHWHEIDDMNDLAMARLAYGRLCGAMPAAGGILPGAPS